MAFATPALGGETAAASVRSALTRRERDTAGTIMAGSLLFATLFTLLILATLLAQLFGEAGPYLADRGISFGTEPIGSDPDSIGVWSGLYGSIGIGIAVILVAIPMGVAAAIYLEEYASAQNRLTQIILVNIRNLAGVPAVIYGVLGFIIFVKWIDPVTFGDSVIAAGLTMAVLVLPIVVITSMEAIRAVPQGLRDGGFGVGASRWEVTRDHVLPYAAPGILTGTVLSLARALGEAAPLIIVGAITGFLPETSITGKFTAVPILIYSWTGRPATPQLRLQLHGGSGCCRCRPAGVGDVLQHLRNRLAKSIRAEAHRLMNSEPSTTLTTERIRRMDLSNETASTTSTPASTEAPVFQLDQVSVLYGDFRAVQGATMVIRKHEITAFIGPSGCGKTTILRCLNRMNDFIETAKVEGTIEYHGVDLYDPVVNSTEVRRRIGMVFQKPNPFPKSIYDNVAYGPRLMGIKKKAELDVIVERSLKGAALWDEVKDRLKSSGLSLSGGQQQRLCIGRAIAVEPDVILMDEPCSALDPIATAKIEELMQEIKTQYTIVIVTHNMQQAARVSDRTAFFTTEVGDSDRRTGQLIEFNPTSKIFSNPDDDRTEQYVTGRFG